jgi:uncharacterized RDD family membrane protein YckC
MSPLDTNPYAAPEAPITPVVLDGDDLPLASLGWRFVAFWIDYVFVAGAVYALVHGMQFGGHAVADWLRASAWFHARSPDDPLILVVAVVGGATFLGVVLGVPITGVAWLESSRWQATPGKRLLGLRVVNLQGGRVRFGQAMARTMLKVCGLLLYGLGALPALFTRRRQTLHHLLEKTLVVRHVPPGRPD